ncbi:OmpA family protein [Falsiroseomonas sp. HW251]|uniref:OmpA family protein n=1 Tax=Falsiroseomonas sp. HW251 TaxID=3390998 RepID=UPI003D3222CF
MRALLFGLLLLPGPAVAQPRPFNCIGAEQLEDDVWAVPFARGADRLTEAGRAAIEAASALIKDQPDRNVCVLGHADRGQGAQTSIELAARRARAVSTSLSQQGIERDRIRAEARVGAYSGRGAEPGARAVTIVVMPPEPPQPVPAPPPRPGDEARR